MDFDDFLKISTLYELKTVSRNNSNEYYCDKLKKFIIRKETTAEHVSIAVKLADYLLLTEPEFASLDRLHVHDILNYHDDIEIEAKDVSIDDDVGRLTKEQVELRKLPLLAARYPSVLRDHLLNMDAEYRANVTPCAKFAHGVNHLDALVHELKYPADWGPKGFVEATVRKRFTPSFVYSPTFMQYFERTVDHLRSNGYFVVNQG